MPATNEDHQHAEAFCVMKYATEDRSEIEYIWNSRDGVTPMAIPMRSGREGGHVDWAQDRYAPDYVPPEGSRVFVDTSPEMYREYAADIVERYWDGLPGMPKMKDRWATKEEAIAVLAQERSPGNPSLIDAEEYGRRLHEGTLFVESPVPPSLPPFFRGSPAGDDRFA